MWMTLSSLRMLGDGGEVVGVVIEVVAVGGLGGTSVTAAVMRDDAVAVVEEEHQLGVPVVGGERPAVAEDDGLTGAPVLVVDLQTVFGGNRVHECSPCGVGRCVEGPDVEVGNIDDTDFAFRPSGDGDVPRGTFICMSLRNVEKDDF